jgi:hypothetical protein
MGRIITLPRDWYRYIMADRASEAMPGIYDWHIEDVGSYIGQ